MLTDHEVADLISHAIDLHFHIGEDILPRRYTVDQLLDAERGKIRGIALKSHSFPAISGVIAAERQQSDHVALIGSVTLNYFLGGFNPSAIYAAAVMAHRYPTIVWFPTVHAENHLIKSHSEYEIPPDWVGDPEFKSRPKAELKAIKVVDWAGNLIGKAKQTLDMMERMNCILGTGHLSWQESEVLTGEARRRGLPVMVTHPMQKDIAMPVEVQQRLAAQGAFIEHCYIMYKDRDHEWDYPPEEIVRQIRAVGVNQVILTSDAGQIRNSSSSESLIEYVRLLEAHGITQAELETMLVHNPRRLLGLNE